MKNEVTCLQLWKRWEKGAPDNLKVIEAQRRIANYEKSDWEEMILDATLVVDKLRYLVINDIGLDAIESTEALDYLKEHINKYFFDIDIEHLMMMKILLKFDQQYIKFFNGFEKGLANRLADMIDIRVKEILV
jgi:hypothetical protein